MKHKKQKRLKYFALTMMTAAVCLLMYCGGFYLKSYMENQAEKQKYDSLLQLSRTAQEEEIWTDPKAKDQSFDSGEEKAEENHKPKNENTKTEKKKGGITGKNQKKKSKKKAEIRESFGISWEKLRKINSHIAGWIEIPGADISYPIVQTEDDEYYLTHSFEGKEDAFGCIFLGCENRKNFSDSHSFVYGHNMIGNMMFANLNRYENPEFLSQCPEFIITTPQKKRYYRIFSVEQAYGGSISFEFGYAVGSELYRRQLEMLKQNSMYDTGVEPDCKKKMVTLITCNSRLDRDIRMAVHGICRKSESL